MAKEVMNLKGQEAVAVVSLEVEVMDTVAVEVAELLSSMSASRISIRVWSFSILLKIILTAEFAKFWRREETLTSSMTITTQTGPLDVPGL